MSLRDELVEIFEAAVASLPGDALVRDALARMRTSLPSDPHKIVVIALGKVAGPMAHGAVAALGNCSGLAIGPAGLDAPAGFEAIEGEHPLPGPRSIRAGIRLLSFVSAIRRDQTAVVLLSGGASALAEALPSNLSLLDLSSTTKLLLGAGAPIEEINIVRKHLSRIKGGRLAAACNAERIELLALSDVEHDDLAVIGSGPFSPNSSKFSDVLQIFERWKIETKVPAAVLEHLYEGRYESPQPDDPAFERVRARILAGPKELAVAGTLEAQRRGFRPVAPGEFMKGDVEEVAKRYTRWLESEPGRRSILVAAGEPTVVLPSQAGRGGRSQQLALLMANVLDRTAGEAAFLAAGSDGKDGTSDHAGAVVDGETAQRARSMGFDLDEALRTASSAAACEILGASIPSVASETNLTDLHLLAIG